MFEKRLRAIAPQLLIANGTTDGYIQVADASLFKVKQTITLKSNTISSQNFEIKEISSINLIRLGPINTSIITFSDVSMFLTINLASILATEQKRPSIPYEEYSRAVYEEEPVVADRVILVDKLGNKYDTINRFPVDAEINFTASGITSPEIRNIEILNANTETTIQIPQLAKKFLLRVRGGESKLSFSYTINQSGTQYITVERGAIYEENNLQLTATLNLFVQVTKPNQVIELLIWQ